MFKKIIFASILILGILGGIYHYSAPINQIKRKLQKIPYEDKIFLEVFLKILILDAHGAYVLFGDKPFASSGFHIGLDEEEMIDPIDRKKIRKYWLYKEGWKRWEKYSHLFPSKNFILKGIKDGNFLSISLINKKQFKTTMSFYNDDFVRVLGKNVNPDSILEKHVSENVDLGELLADHDGLYGTLLGYGRDNAWLFKKRARLYPDLTQSPLYLHPKPSANFKSYQEEWNFYQTKLQSFDPCFKRNDMTFLQLPQFLADPLSNETQQLRLKYAEQRHKISKIYQNGNFLIITLTQLMSS